MGDVVPSPNEGVVPPPPKGRPRTGEGKWMGCTYRRFETVGTESRHGNFSEPLNQNDA